MALSPRQPKTTLLTASVTVIDPLMCRVVSPPNQEPITFTDANMRSGIVLCARKFRPCALTKLRPWFPFIHQ